MFSATEFIYDGISSTTYGLKMASFNDNVLDETSYVVPNVVVGKSKESKRFHYLDITYDTPPTYEFSVVSEQAIHEELLSEILIWLDARKGFKPLIILQSTLADFTYRCIFKVTSIVYHGGKCVGLNLSATFDSLYVTGRPIERAVFGSGEEQEITIYNDSDNVDEYIYPTVEFDTEDGKISIINVTDDENREFSFDGVEKNTPYVVDNELRMIKGSSGYLLDKFSKKWLRILRGKNKLKIRVNGSVMISFPRKKKIIF